MENEKKLTDEEIVKSLEVCVNWEKPKDCEECPLCGRCRNNFGEKLYLDFIYRLQDKNKRLTEENAALSKGVTRLKKRYDEAIKQNADECVKKFCETTMYAEQERLVKENSEQKAEIERLTEENKKLSIKVWSYEQPARTPLYSNENADLKAKNTELQKQVDELTKELSNVPDPFPCKVGSGCEAAGKGCYDCPNNRYRQQAAKEILQRGKYCMPSGLREWIEEKYGVEVE